MSSSAAVFALRRLRRGWRSGELLILTLALLVSVAAASAVGLFTDRVRAAVAAQSGEAIGADAILSSRDALPDELIAQLRGLGLAVARTVEFPSVAVAGDRTQLVSVKAAQQGYPLRGRLRIADQAFAAPREVAGLPGAGEAWVDPQVWQELGLAPGASLQLGATAFKVSALIEYEPDRGAGFANLAPRVLIRHDDLQATGLLAPGSRVQHALLLGGTPQQIGQARALKLPENARLMSPEEAKPEVGRALGRAGQFLDIAVLAATLLAAAAVALSARQHGQQQCDEVALLKCLGAGSRFVGLTLSLQLLLLGLIAGLAGAAIGYAGQAVLAQLLGGLVQAELPAPGLTPLLMAWLLELLLLLGFALPPLLQARKASPIRVFQRDLRPDSSLGITLLAFASAVALLFWQAGDAPLALRVLGGTLAAGAALAALAWLLVGVLTPLRRRGHTAIRFGLGNVARRRGASVAQIVALGLALLSLLLVTVVQRDLLSAWQNRVPPDAPNQFLINIQPQQVAELRRFFAERGFADLDLWPMTRARLVELKGKRVTVDSFDDPETRRWINREFNLSWAPGFGEDNQLLEGAFWTAADAGKPWLSITDYVVERLHVGVGDTLTLQVADQEIRFTVKNVRKVNWESFRPNFFLVAAPGVIDESGGNAQYLTSLRLPPQGRALLRELVTAFPNVTAFDIEATMNQVRGIMDRITRAVQFVFLFTVAAGACVLLAAIETTRAERVRETALLRTLGASRRTIAGGLVAEYAALGLVAGLVAATAAQLIAWVLARQVFELPYSWSPALWLGGALSGAVLVVALGWWSLHRVLDTPPRAVLAG